MMVVCTITVEAETLGGSYDPRTDTRLDESLCDAIWSSDIAEWAETVRVEIEVEV